MLGIHEYTDKTGKAVHLYSDFADENVNLRKHKKERQWNKEAMGFINYHFVQFVPYHMLYKITQKLVWAEMTTIFVNHFNARLSGNECVQQF